MEMFLMFGLSDFVKLVEDEFRYCDEYVYLNFIIGIFSSVSCGKFLDNEIIF